MTNRHFGVRNQSFFAATRKLSGGHRQPFDLSSTEEVQIFIFLYDYIEIELEGKNLRARSLHLFHCGLKIDIVDYLHLDSTVDTLVDIVG